MSPRGAQLHLLSLRRLGQDVERPPSSSVPSESSPLGLELLQESRELLELRERFLLLQM